MSCKTLLWQGMACLCCSLTNTSLKAQNSLKKLERIAVDNKRELFKEKRLAVRKKLRDKLCNLLCCCGSSSEVDAV